MAAIPRSSQDWLGCPCVPVLAAKTTPDEKTDQGESDCKVCNTVFH